jgi:hypothetical protein
MNNLPSLPASPFLIPLVFILTGVALFAVAGDLSSSQIIRSVVRGIAGTAVILGTFKAHNVAYAAVKSLMK